jgi:DNA-binding transcriptional regulator of glucitol operon
MDTRKYLLIVLAFLVVACIGMWSWTRYSAATGKPYTNRKGPAGDGTTVLDKGGNR